MHRVPTAPVALVAACVVALGCATTHAKESEWHPVPDVSPDSTSAVRGTAASAGALSNEDQSEIVSFVLRSFYYPTSSQARWLDPRPLAHVRLQAADDTVGADPDFADEVLSHVHNRRVCILGGVDRDCKGKPGGVVRFSWPYGVGRDSAIVYATYSPRDSLGNTSRVESEMQFRMKRNSDEEWETVGKNTVTAFGSPAGAKPAGKP